MTERVYRKRMQAVVSAALFFLLLVLPGRFAVAQDLELKMADDISRPPVLFPHELHMNGYDCFDCHHDYDESGNNILDDYALEEGNPDILCGACHSENNAIETREAFHRQCMGCHERFTFKKRPTGPVLCGECHIREKE